MRMLTILAFAVTAFQANSLSAAELAPHEAEYKTTLLKYLGPGRVDSFEGTVLSRQSRDCQKWKLEALMISKFNLNGQYIEWRISVKQYEALDGSRVEYDVQLRVDGDVKERKKGSARLEGPGKPGIAKYRIPEESPGELPAGTRFSIAALSASIDLMAAGKKKWTQVVFAGGVLRNVSVSVTKRGVAAPVAPAGDADLLSGNGWVVKTTGRDAQSNAVTMETEQTIHDNGVASRAVTNDGIWVTRSDLIGIKRLPTPQC